MGQQVEIRMTDDRILVDPMENREFSDGGIFVGEPTTTFHQGDGNARQITHGRVVAVGPGRAHKRTGVRLPVGVEVGEYVSFSDTCHRPAGIPDGEYVVIRGGDVALVSDEPFEHVEVLY